MQKNSRSILPVATANWGVLKREVPGLDAAAKGAQRIINTSQFKASDIRIWVTPANHAESMRILQEYALRPLTLEEILFAVADRKLIKQLTKLKDACGSFYIMDQIGRLPQTPGLHIIEPDLSLSVGRSEDPEKNVLCIMGSNPPSFHVHRDKCGASSDRRFNLDTHEKPTTIVPLVVGLPIEVPIA